MGKKKSLRKKAWYKHIIPESYFTRQNQFTMISEYSLEDQTNLSEETDAVVYHHDFT